MAATPLVDRDKYSELFLTATRWTGLLASLLATIYALTIWGGLSMPGPLYSFGLLLFTTSALLVIGIIQFIHKPHTVVSLGFYISFYNVFGIAFLIFCAGFINPLAICWILTITITDLFYGRRAAAGSAVIFILASILTYLYEPVPSTALFTTYVLYIAIIVTISGLISMLRRIQRLEHTDLQRTQSQEQFQRGQLTTLINSLNAAILSISSNGTVRVYNAALLSLLDTNQSLSGKNIDTVLNLYDAHGEPVSLVDLSQKTNKIIDRDDLVHRFDDGEAIRLSVSCAPIRGRFSNEAKHREGFIFIMRDITKEKSLEEERDEFISVVSHELRTPIAITEGTLSNLQLLLDRSQDPKALSGALKDAHEQVIYLASMVNDLSTLSRAERGVADQPEEVDVRMLLEELYHRYQAKAMEKGLELNLDAKHKLGTIQVSRLYLEEILQNFITNAIKYTQKGSVTLEAHRLSHGVEFSVHDTGIGISKSEQKHIFEKFYRSEDYRTRETSGTGLGLYVVKKLADKLGIEIECESRLNHGSKFQFVLHETPAVIRDDTIGLTKE